jgi:hypothetical protein
VGIDGLASVLFQATTSRLGDLVRHPPTSVADGHPPFAPDLFPEEEALCRTRRESSGLTLDWHSQ